MKYQTKPRPALAKVYDGTTAGGYEILAWVYRQGSGNAEVRDNSGYLIFRVAGVQIHKDDYVVVAEDDKTAYVYKPDKFVQVFDERAE